LLALIFIAIALFSLTIGQSLNYEFANNDLSSNFYDIIMSGLPIAILLTLVGTIKMKNERTNNIAIAVGTIFASIVSFFAIINIMFSVGFVVIENEAVLFRKKDNPNIIIATQSIGYGVFSEDGHRTVQLQPFLKFWNKVTVIDTTSIDKKQWEFVNERKVINANWKIEDGKLIYY